MANRAGCGVPEGYTWKRIDYAWYRNLTPVSMTRFGMKTPGDGSPSDHYGIVAEYAEPLGTSDSTPPTASITAPAANASVSGTVNVAVNATDDRAVARVDLLVDNVVGGSATASPYTIAWDSTKVVNGAHNLVARAYDGASNSGESSIVTVLVNNTPPPPTPSQDVILVDDHFDTLDKTIWTGGTYTSTPDTTVPLTATGGELQIGPLKSSLTGSHYNGIDTAASDLAGGGYAYAQLAQSPNRSTSAFAMFSAGSDGSNFYRLYESANAIVAEKKLAGTKTTLVSVPYDPATMQFLQIRYDAAAKQVVFETAPANGTAPGAMTARYTEAWDSRVALTGIKFELKAGTSESIASPGTVLWDNFRAVRAVAATTPATGTIVRHPGTTAIPHGNWQVVADATAADGYRIEQPDAGVPKIVTPLANPENYFELTFNTEANTPYRLWFRGRAQADSYNNDSFYVQFSGSVTSTGTPINRILTTEAVSMVLEDCSGCGVAGWGWQDNGYGTGVLGPVMYFTAGQQTMRIQGREDGLSIDQIVLSPDTYLTTSPGATKNDTTILSKTP